jgi:hypothetical protein
MSELEPWSPVLIPPCPRLGHGVQPPAWPCRAARRVSLRSLVPRRVLILSRIRWFFHNASVLRERRCPKPSESTPPGVVIQSGRGRRRAGGVRAVLASRPRAKGGCVGHEVLQIRSMLECSAAPRSATSRRMHAHRSRQAAGACGREATGDRGGAWR